MPDIKYPVRCQIIDADGAEVAGAFTAQTPEASRPHIGKEGLAELVDEWHVRITLDDGNIINGEDCWWVPIGEEETKDG